MLDRIDVAGNPVNLVDPWGLKTYSCTKPLDALTSAFGSGFSQWAHDNVPMAYHQYTCTDHGGKNNCGGQIPSGNPLFSPGEQSHDDMSSGVCKEDQPDNNCYEMCLLYEWAKPRPLYGIPVFTDCQDYDGKVVEKCKKQCNIK